MAVEAPPQAAAPIASPTKPSRARRNDNLRSWTLGLWSALALLYLFIPILVIVVFSFNDPAGRFNYTWTGFTLENWAHPFATPGIQHALVVSLEIAALSSVCATLLGSGTIGLAALLRRRKRTATEGA